MKSSTPRAKGKLLNGDGPSETPEKETPENAKVPKNETVVCLLGRLSIGSEKVSVGVVTGKETIVQLSKPAKLGNALDVGSWLNDSWATEVPALLVKEERDANKKIGKQAVQKNDVVNHLKKEGYPDQVTNLLAELFLAPIYITDLYIRRWKEEDTDKDYKTAFKFGIAVKFANPQNKGGLTLFNDIRLDDVALGIISAPKEYKFDEAELALPPLTLVDFEEAEREEKEAAAEADGTDEPEEEEEGSDPAPEPLQPTA